MKPGAWYNKTLLKKFYMEKLGFVPVNYRHLPDTEEFTSKVLTPEVKYSLDTLENECPAPTCKSIDWDKVFYPMQVNGSKKQEEEITMSNTAVASAAVSSPDTDITNQRRYFKDRIISIKSIKTGDLYRAFGIGPFPAPKTLEETIQRLIDKKFRVKERPGYCNDEYELGPAIRLVEWSDPDIKKDQAGLDKALEALEKASERARDLIMAQSPETFPQILDDFEKTDFTK